ncbi:hypothetical protein NA57DRAFT_80112 [Rhizodiscina lignyota]|uniref:Uncharacterized protein n=1 Tax=Rhizodiscina lignyota TaxID=1504668 RepID=A0A9P4M2T8_9PEZI|nr:hypothetical protein NA57DRAFT_80112 [Rhizodiscina lignyota]
MASIKKPSYAKEPEKFPWEQPTPTGPFWIDISERLSSQFLSIWGTDGLAELPLDPLLSKEDKILLFRRLLDEKLKQSESTTPPDRMSEDDFRLNRKMHFALMSTYTETKEWAAAHEAGKAMSKAYEARHGRPDLGSLNTMAWTAERMGEYALADTLCLESLPHLKRHDVLGPDSPQVLGTMRLRMLILGKIGRIVEAKELNKQGYRVIESMKGGKFEKYYEEEIEAMNEIRSQLEKAEVTKETIPEDWEPEGSA